MFRGKKYQDAAKQIEKNTQYDASTVSWARRCV